MVFTPSFVAVVLTFLLALPASADNPSGLYTKKSPVVQVTAKTYDNLIAKSNQSAILEFYAPWCGHCQNLKPAYEKAAKSVENLSAKVAAINCDDDDNKAFCGQMGVKGFPTLKTVKPGKKPGKPIVSDYTGERTAKAIADALIDTIPNHVIKVTDDNLEKFLKDWNHMPKAILFADKGSTSPLLKSLAIDFKDSLKIAQIHKKQEGCIEAFGITEFPRLLLLPGPEAKGEIFLGEMKDKDELVAFLSQAASPNPEADLITITEPKKSSSKKGDKTKTKPKKKDSMSEDQKIIKEEKEKLKDAFDSFVPPPDGFQSASADFPVPTEQVDISKTPVMHIQNIRTPEELNEKCLSEDTGTCILAFVPQKRTPLATQVLRSLAEINDHFLKTKTKAFPFYAIPLEGMGMDSLQGSLGDDGEVELIAVNRKRGWWRHFNGIPTMTKEAIEEWIDEIRFGGKEEEKLKLPDDNSFVGTDRVEKYDPTEFRAPIDDEDEESEQDWDAEIKAAEAAASAAAENADVEESVTPEADPVEEPVAHEADPVVETSSEEPTVAPEETPAPETDHDEL